MTAILGGGISGLSAAYYALENPKLGSIVLYEATNRLGGWVWTKKSPNGGIFEQGPRTIRPHGDAGKNTLKLIDALKLDHKIVSIPVNHPAAMNRLIYIDKKLHILPISLKPLFRTCPPFKRPLFKAIWSELNTPSITLKDESVYDFIERRVGKDIADNIISPIICGICAGDAKQISVNFLMPKLFQAEQKHGSIFKGLLKERMMQNSRKTKIATPKDPLDMDSVERAGKEKWAIWTLEGGLEQLPQKLADNLNSRDVSINMESECRELTFHSDCVEIKSSGETKKFDRIISSLPARNLAALVKKQHPDLASELEGIPTVTVGIVNLEFPREILVEDAFGFLVPPQEGLPILGTIFDSCVSPQENAVFTVMLGGAWFEEYFGTNPSEEHLLKVALEQLRTILNIVIPPIGSNVSILRNCIPQYIVGHQERKNRIQNYIEEHKIPLGLCGSSYEGVGVNDVILSAKKAVSNIN